MLTRLEFDELVQNLERRYENRPRSLQHSIITWMSLGCAFLALALIVSVAALYFLISLYLTTREDLVALLFFGFFPGYIAWSILRGLLVMTPSPKGVEARQEEYTKLFEMIHEIAGKAGGIHFHKVLISDDFNAAVCQRRLFIIGPRRRFLLLGLPLMDSLAPEELRAVIAHEFHHLSPSHTRAARWIYGVRSRWEMAAEALSRDQAIGARFFQKFVHWVWPQIHARIAILQRQMEYECDAFSSEVTHPITVGNALLRNHFADSRVGEKFWNRIERRSQSDAEPPKSVFHELEQFLKDPVDSGEYARWLEKALKFVEGTSDSHPTLKRRLDAVGASYSPYDLPLLKERASEFYLGLPAVERIRNELNRLWFEAVQCEWSQTYQGCVNLQESISNPQGPQNTRDTKWNTLVLKVAKEGFSTMKPELFSWISEHPDDTEAKYLIGSDLVSSGDVSGVPLLEEVIRYRADLSLDCFGLLEQYYQSQGDIAAAREIRRRSDQFEVEAKTAAAERQIIHPSDVPLPHQLRSEDLDNIRHLLEQHPEIQQAWLFRLKYRTFPDWPHYTMIVKMKLPRFKLVITPPITRIFGNLYQHLIMNGSLLLVDSKTWKRRGTPLPDHLDTLIYEKKK